MDSISVRSTGTPMADPLTPSPSPARGEGRGDMGLCLQRDVGSKRAGVVTNCTTTHRVQIFPPLPLRERGWG